MPAARSGSGSSVRLPAKLTAGPVMVLPLSCCLAGRSALPLDPGDGGHRGMPQGRQGQAVEPRKPAMHDLASFCRLRSRVVDGRLRLVVGNASTVRPAPSTLGVVGERGSRHEGRSPARSRRQPGASSDDRRRRGPKGPPRTRARRWINRDDARAMNSQGQFNRARGFARGATCGFVEESCCAAAASTREGRIEYKELLGRRSLGRRLVR
jgi:hypothetical protein